MRQRINPWVVVLTAALTFGSLMALVGPRSFGHHRWGRYGYYDQQHHRHGHGGYPDYYRDRAIEKADSGSVQ
jgi:hypothetical protein